MHSQVINIAAAAREIIADVASVIRSPRTEEIIQSKVGAAAEIESAVV